MINAFLTIGLFYIEISSGYAHQNGAMRPSDASSDVNLRGSSPIFQLVLTEPIVYRRPILIGAMETNFSPIWLVGITGHRPPERRSCCLQILSTLRMGSGTRKCRDRATCSIPLIFFTNVPIADDETLTGLEFQNFAPSPLAMNAYKFSV